MKAPERIALVAGETSGDMLAAILLAGLRQRWPEAHTYGIGGHHMLQQHFKAWWPSDKLAVRGYVEVLRHYVEIVGLRKTLLHRLQGQARPDLFIGVDAPDFNLTLEEQLRRSGIPTVHFVCPSIWAWRAHRVQQIRRSANHVLCIFPFEPALLAEHGIEASYVGHPLAQTIPLSPDQGAARQKLQLDSDKHIVALLPGSRVSEVQHLAGRFFQAARLIQMQRPGCVFLVPAIERLRPAIEAAARQAGLVKNIHIVAGQSHTVLAACDVALVASGTATLEAALFKRPMVIAYHMNALSWQITRRQRLQPWVGLPNIMCQDFVVPELLQGAATPAAMAAELIKWLDHPVAVQALQQRFTHMHHELRRDTASLATDAIEKVLSR